MPVVGVVILPICAVAVGMAAACCGDLCGFKNLLADGAFLMLSAFCGFGSCRVNDPLAGAVSRNIGLVAALALMPVVGVVILPIRTVGMLGGFGVGGAVRHLADGAVAAMCAVSVIRPRRERMRLNVVAVACLALLIVIAGIQIQVRLTGVVMLVVSIQSNAVIRIRVGEDGQIGGVVCIQLILRNSDGDGVSGGRRGLTADGNGQCSVVAVRIGKLFHLGGQTCGQVEPGGNIIACRNILKTVAVHADDHILRQRLADLAVDGHIVDGGGVSPGVGGGCGFAGDGRYIIQSIRSFCVITLGATGAENACSEFIYSNTRLRIVLIPLRIRRLFARGDKLILHLHAIELRRCQISLDAAGVGRALRGDDWHRQGRIGILGKGSRCQRTPLFGICGSVVVVGSCLDGGGLRQRDTLGIRVGILGRGAGLGVCAVGGVGDFKDFLTGVQGVGDGHLDFPDELGSVSGGKLHLGSLRPVDPADHELVAGELLTVCRHNDGIDLCHLAGLCGNIHRDGVSGVDKEVTAGGYGGIALLQLPLGDGCGEGDGSLAAVIHLRPAIDGLLSERNLLESGVHFHITVRHNKGCFLLGRICEGHAGGIRIPPGEHHVVGGIILRLHGNGFTGDCRGGICRASAIRDRDAVRHGCGGRGRRFAHYQLNDMLIAENADGAAILFQIQVQIKGIDLGVCALRNGEAIFGVGGADGISGGRVIAGDIAIAPGIVAIACACQFGRQRIPLEFDGMRRAVVHPLNGALPVLEVVDGVAVQCDGLHAPCVGDDRGRLVIHSLDLKYKAL